MWNQRYCRRKTESNKQMQSYLRHVRRSDHDHETITRARDPSTCLDWTWSKLSMFFFVSSLNIEIKQKWCVQENDEFCFMWEKSVNYAQISRSSKSKTSLPPESSVNAAVIITACNHLSSCVHSTFSVLDVWKNERGQRLFIKVWGGLTAKVSAAVQLIGVSENPPP